MKSPQVFKGSSNCFRTVYQPNQTYLKAGSELIVLDLLL